MKQSLKIVPNMIHATLSQDIDYCKDGSKIVVPAGTLILVDAERGIALVGDDHVDIFSDEYVAA